MSSNKWYEESYVQLLFFRKLPSLDFSVGERRNAVWPPCILHLTKKGQCFLGIKLTAVFCNYS